MYAIVVVPFDDKPKILYIHHRTASDGWSMDFWCEYCFEELKLVVEPIVDNCNLERSCLRNPCLRQPPTFRA